VNVRSIVVRRVAVALAALAVILPAIAARADAFVCAEGVAWCGVANLEEGVAKLGAVAEAVELGA